MLVALIMAGGKGTRFWPMSTEEKPKQFLKLIDERTMIQATVDRLEGLIDIENVFICTGAKYVDLVKEQLPRLPERNIIVEPAGRNTAPCILLSSLYIKQIYKNANIIVLPSDHKINNEPEFLNILSSANKFIKRNNKAIITIGIQPDRPETGYGYINFGEDEDIIGNYHIKKVNRFVEKPSLEKAKEYLGKGTYLWNAGMFMFNSNFMIDEFKQYFTAAYNILSSLPLIEDNGYMEELEDKYALCEAISIDYAIMEKSKYIYVIPGNFGWDDIGSWKALERYIPEDKNKNIFKGNVKGYNSNHNTVYGTDKQIILLDASDLFIIETDNKIVIGKKDSLPKVHKLRGK